MVGIGLSVAVQNDIPRYCSAAAAPWREELSGLNCLGSEDDTYCMATHIARVWINRVRLPKLLVVSRTGKMNISLPAFVPENLVSRDGFGSPIPRQSAHLHIQAESSVYLRDSSRVPRRRPFIYFKPPYAIGSVPSLSGHAIAYL